MDSSIVQQIIDGWTIQTGNVLAHNIPFVVSLVVGVFSLYYLSGKFWDKYY